MSVLHRDPTRPLGPERRATKPLGPGRVAWQKSNPGAVQCRPMRDPASDLKQQLGAELARLMVGWTTSELYFALEVDQPRISELRRQKLDRFSIESLVR